MKFIPPSMRGMPARLVHVGEELTVARVVRGRKCLPLPPPSRPVLAPKQTLVSSVLN